MTFNNPPSLFRINFSSIRDTSHRSLSVIEFIFVEQNVLINEILS